MTSLKHSSHTMVALKSAKCRTFISYTPSGTSWKQRPLYANRKLPPSAKYGSAIGANRQSGEHKQLNGILDQAVERFKGLSDDEKDEFKSKLVGFRNLYAFLAQVIPYKDSDLEKLYTYTRFCFSSCRADQVGPAMRWRTRLRSAFTGFRRLAKAALTSTKARQTPKRANISRQPFRSGQRGSALAPC